MENPANSQDYATTNPLMSVFLWVFAQLSYILSILIADLNFSDVTEFVWKWVFRGITLLSLVLVCAINWEKGTDIIKEKFKSMFKKR